MAGLIKNPNVSSENKKDSKTISRGHEYHPSNPVEPGEMNNSKSDVELVSYITSVRVDNHIKNQLQAMSIIGYATSQKDAIETMISAWRESQSPEQLRLFDAQVKTLEAKDVRLKSKK
ncbi:DUF5388 domain-containing protein [Furfurilactobacillus milii]|uniref:Uncharacterized protein n=1 Tax=Furfurilactobacillus milii TaxID=2888272 RepID=A0A6N9HZZ5_9LACO|nr:DUF5388 domain-containing protein [Furfurilactobacillus milii]MYV16442.1 hypothetical protein [Furfurilactobacillus milii]